MKSSVLALRSIAAEFAIRIYLPILLVSIIVSVVVIGLTIWLTTINAWWWILAVLVFIVVFLLTVILVATRIVIMLVKPSQTKKQRGMIKQFVDGLQNLSEITQTPKIVLIFRVLSDALRSKDSGFVRETIAHASNLRSDFEAIKRTFDN